MIPCDYSTKWLREFELTGVQVTTVTQPCASPANLTDASWNSLMPEDFGTDCTCTGRHCVVSFHKKSLIRHHFTKIINKLTSFMSVSHCFAYNTDPQETQLTHYQLFELSLRGVTH